MDVPGFFGSKKWDDVLIKAINTYLLIFFGWKRKNLFEGSLNEVGYIWDTVQIKACAYYHVMFRFFFGSKFEVACIWDTVLIKAITHICIAFLPPCSLHSYITIELHTTQSCLLKSRAEVTNVWRKRKATYSFYTEIIL